MFSRCVRELGASVRNFTLTQEVVHFNFPGEGVILPYFKSVHHTDVVDHSALQFKVAAVHCAGGLIHDTKSVMMYSVKCALHKMGCTDVKLGGLLLSARLNLHALRDF